MSRLGYYGSFEREDDSYYYRIVPLDTCVLVVATVTKRVGEWAAYVGAVDGQRHVNEWDSIRRSGTKLDKHIAEAMFPELAIKYYWRE